MKSESWSIIRAATLLIVIPARAGIHLFLPLNTLNTNIKMDSGFRRNDGGRQTDP